MNCFRDSLCSMFQWFFFRTFSKGTNQYDEKNFSLETVSYFCELVKYNEDFSEMVLEVLCSTIAVSLLWFCTSITLSLREFWRIETTLHQEKDLKQGRSVDIYGNEFTILTTHRIEQYLSRLRRDLVKSKKRIIHKNHLMYRFCFVITLHFVWILNIIR